jgi:hypothetical protein
MGLSTTELQDQLKAIEKAYYSGATKVKYADREVNYRTLAEMQTIIDNLQKKLGLKSGIKFVETTFDNGLK